MKQVFIFILFCLFLVSLIQFSYLAIWKNFISSNNQLDENNIVNQISDYSLLSIYNSSKENSFIAKNYTIEVNQKFYEPKGLDSNNNFTFKSNNKIQNGCYKEDKLTLTISEKEYMKFEKLGNYFMFIYFGIQTLLLFLLFYISFLFYKRNYYQPQLKMLLYILSITTLIIGVYKYCEGYFQQYFLNKILQTNFVVENKSIWEYVPLEIIFGIFFLFLTVLYKEMLSLKEQNDLTI
ncbi:MAG: hypothetical protein KA275_02500 [Chitinophagaceae bacterium]|nr:hypothetical protein [Chitinophagaceae bacterium]